MHLTCSFLSISNMLCVGGGGGNRVVTLAVVYDPVFRVIKYGPWISQASVTCHICSSYPFQCLTTIVSPDLVVIVTSVV